VNRVRGIKNLIWISIAIALLATTLVNLGATSPGTTFFAGAGGASIGETFHVFPTVSGMPTFPYPEKLFLAEFSMSFDPDVLEVIDIDIGELDYVYIEEWDNGAGWLHAVIGRPPGQFEGLMGDVEVGTITFLLKAEGSSALHLYNTRLKNMAGADMSHTTVDGWTLTPPMLYIRRREGKVYPGWHSRSWYEGLTNTLYADIANYDTAAYTIKVMFVIDAGPMGIISLETDPATVPAAVWNDDVTPGMVTVSAEFTVPMSGTYYVSAALFLVPYPGSRSDSIGGEGISRDIATRFKAR
jgi:hypothetical protein